MNRTVSICALFLGLAVSGSALATEDRLLPSSPLALEKALISSDPEPLFDSFGGCMNGCVAVGSPEVSVGTYEENPSIGNSSMWRGYNASNIAQPIVTLGRQEANMEQIKSSMEEAELEKTTRSASLPQN